LTTDVPIVFAVGWTAFSNQAYSAAASLQFIVAGGDTTTEGSAPIDFTRIGVLVPHLPALMGGKY